MSGTKKTHILKTECMIGNRTFPTRNKTQIIKKKPNHCRWICILLHFLCVYCIYYEKVEGVESQQDKNQQLILHWRHVKKWT